MGRILALLLLTLCSGAFAADAQTKTSDAYTLDGQSGSCPIGPGPIGIWDSFKGSIFQCSKTGDIRLPLNTPGSVSAITYLLQVVVTILGFAVMRQTRRVRKVTEAATLLDPESGFPPRVGMPFLNDAVDEFRRHLRDVSTTDEVPQKRSLRPVDSSLPDEAFIQATTLSRWLPANIRAVHVAPGVLTGLGLLGTFVGISLGLGGIDFGADQGSSAVDPKALAESVPKVIAGLSTAFWTSIVGLVPALLIGLFGHRSEERLLRAVSTLRDLLQARYPTITTEEMLFLHIGQQREMQRTDVDRLEVLRGIAEDGQQARAHLQTLANDVSAGFDKSIKNELVPLLEKLADVVAKQVTQASQAGQDAARQFTDEMVTRLTGTLSTSMNSLTTKLSGAGDQLGKMTAGVHSLIGEVDKTVGQAKAMAEQSAATVRQSEERTRVSAEQLQRTMESIETLGSMLGLMHKAEQQAHEHHVAEAELQKVVIQRFGDASKNVGASAETIADATDRFAELVQSMQSAVTSLVSSANAASGAAEASSEAMILAANRLEQRSGVEASLLEQYEAAARDFGRAFQSASPAVASLETFARQMGDVRVGIERQLAAISAMQQMLTKTGGDLRDSLASLNGAGASMSQVVQGTTAWSREAQAAIQRFTEGLTKAVTASLQSYDQSLAHAVNSMASWTYELDDVVRRLGTFRAPETPSVPPAPPAGRA